MDVAGELSERGDGGVERCEKDAALRRGRVGACFRDSRWCLRVVETVTGEHDGACSGKSRTFASSRWNSPQSPLSATGNFPSYEVSTKRTSRRSTLGPVSRGRTRSDKGPLGWCFGKATSA